MHFAQVTINVVYFKKSSPNDSIGDPAFQTNKTWIPAQKRCGNDRFGEDSLEGMYSSGRGNGLYHLQRSRGEYRPDREQGYSQSSCDEHISSGGRCIGSWSITTPIRPPRSRQ